jgi:competence protein ComEA
LAGVHRFSGTVTVDSVNKMTGIKGLCRDGDDRIGGEVLQSGDLVTYRRSPAGCVTIAVKTVTTAEKILLGIPLDPNRMTYDDWVALPGIGPAMASAIIHDRQKNGDYAGAESLQRVPGLGRARVEALSAYFR